MGTGEMGSPAMEKYPIQGEIEVLLAAKCYGNRDKLQLMSLVNAKAIAADLPS